jgi:HK97 family phage major capsid protein/HK97 family phage prohead protease
MTQPDTNTIQQRKGPPTSLPLLTRFMAIPDLASALDIEARTLQLSFSSEFPVERWYGSETLSHAPGAADLSRLNDGAPLLFNHNMDDVIGVVQTAAVDSAQRKGYATVRFANTPRAAEVMQMVQDNILRNVSFMYRVPEYTDMGNEQYIATQWAPLEISIVTIPADPTVGVGRATDNTEQPVRITRAAAEPVLSPAAPAARTTTGVTTMSKENEIAAGTSAAANTEANVVDIQAARAGGAGEERARISEIESMCSAHKLSPELRADMISKGVTIAEARGLVLADLGKRGQQQSLSTNGHAPDLTGNEKRSYSMVRAINASISGNWSKAGFEREVSDDIAKRMGKDANGFFMPTNLPFAQRAYNTGSPTAGGDLVATQLLAGSFIEILRNQSRVMSLGATVLSGLIGNVDIPRRTNATNTYWVGEVTGVTPSQGAFDKVSLGMKTIGALSVITRNMLMQATPDIEMLVRADMVAQLALGIDLAALSGSGSAMQPLGISGTAGIGSVIGGTNGGALTIDNLIDLETSVTAANAPEDKLAYLANARSVGALKKLKSTTGEYLWVTTADMGRTGTPGEINGYTVARSNQARSNLTKGAGTNLSELFFGSWGELLIGEWGVLEVQPNPYAASVSAQGGVELRALQSIDIAARHAASFAIMSDAITG